MTNRKPVEGFPRYIIDNAGNIYMKNGKKMRPHTGKGGYSQIILTNDHEKKTFLVHRLVALHFLEKADPSSEVNHKNGNKLDNRAENLEWISHGENLRHAFETGLREQDVAPKQITGTKIDTGEKITFSSIYKAARALNISQGNICMACKGLRPYAGGYTWAYSGNE